MKKSIFILTLLCGLILITNSVQAQDYNTAIGLRLGYPFSASIKHFIGGKNHALEGYVGYRGWGFGNGISVNGAYQIHNEIADVSGLQWYYGGGAGVYFWSYDDGFFGGETYSSTSVALQGYLGLEYTIGSAPVAISLDWIPSIFFLNGYTSGFGAGYGGLAVRYTLSK